MRKNLLFILIALGVFIKGQSSSVNLFEDSVNKLSNARSEENFNMLIANFEKSEVHDKWKKFYYLGVAHYLKGELALKNGKSLNDDTNPLAGKNIAAVYTSQQNNPEVIILVGMYLLQRLQIQSGLDTNKEISKIANYIKQADILSENNPRLTILKAKLAEYQKDENLTKILYEKASEEFKSGLTSNIYNWGKQLVK